jgi:2-succinyl-5-enolpyruvyl-6-hydroxy-3-cyclohexene-1-carboxylate synthase
VVRLARVTGFPLAAEATSQLRFGPRPEGVTLLDGLDLLLRAPTFRAKTRFDVAIQIGEPPTSGAWEAVAPSVARVVLAERDWPDPQSRARVIVLGDIAASCLALADALQADPPRGSREFTRSVHAAQEVAWEAVGEELGRDAAWSEASAVRALIDAAPAGSFLALGNSLPVRHVDIYVRATDHDLHVLSQRGASGIDGLVAGAAGAATAAGRPIALLLGDVSLLHDLTSLRLAAQAKTPLVILVLHNGGGRIFEHLPIADVAGIDPAILEHMTTPHDTDFAPAAALAGVAHARATTRGELGAAIDAAFARSGCTLVEARLPPGGARETSKRVGAAVDAALVAHFAAAPS